MDSPVSTSRQQKTTEWSSQRLPDTPVSSASTGPSSNTAATATKYRLEDIEVVDLTAAGGSTARQTVADNQHVTSRKRTDEHSVMMESTTEGLATNVSRRHDSVGTALDAPFRSGLSPTNRSSMSSPPLFVPIQQRSLLWSVPSEEFRLSSSTAPVEEEHSERREFGRASMPKDYRSSSGISRVSPLFKSSVTDPEANREESRSRDFDLAFEGQTDLIGRPEEVSSSQFRTPTKQTHKGKFRSPKDLVNRVQHDVRKEIEGGKQGQKASTDMDALGFVNPMIIGEDSSPVRRSVIDLWAFELEDSSNDSLPSVDNDSEEQVKKEEDSDKELEYMSSPTEKKDIRRKAMQKLSGEAGQQLSRPVRATPREPQQQRFVGDRGEKRKGPSESSKSPTAKRVPQLAIKSRGMHRSRNRLNTGEDGARDSPEYSDNEQRGKLCSSFDEVCLSDSSEAAQESSEYSHGSNTNLGKAMADDNPDTIGDETTRLHCDELHSVIESIIASASSKYRLSIDKSKIAGAGWALFTQDDIPKGKEIFVKPVFAHAFDVRSTSLACDHCFFIPNRDGHEGELQPCLVCNVAHYCSQECIDEAYKRHHWAECQIVRKLPGYSNLPPGWRIALRILIQKHYEPEFERAWQQMLMLASNKEKLTPNSRNMRNAKVAQEVVELCFEEEAGEGYDVCEFLLRIFLNQGTLVLADGKDLGAMVDPLLSMINHDCAPNASAPVCQDGWMILRSTRAIAAGEEIKVCYIDGRHAVERRQLYLNTNWQFQCSCARCKAEIQRKAENKR